MKVRIEAQSLSEQPLHFDGETVVVNHHGALISTTLALHVGMRIEVHVILTGKRALAHVAYVDPANPLLCGIGLEKAQNIWGIRLPPDDWKEEDS
jgi:hypothetical protein